MTMHGGSELSSDTREDPLWVPLDLPAPNA